MTKLMAELGYRRQCELAIFVIAPWLPLALRILRTSSIATQVARIPLVLAILAQWMFGFAAGQNILAGLVVAGIGALGLFAFFFAVERERIGTTSRTRFTPLALTILLLAAQVAILPISLAAGEFFGGVAYASPCAPGLIAYYLAAGLVVLIVAVTHAHVLSIDTPFHDAFAKMGSSIEFDAGVFVLAAIFVEVLGIEGTLPITAWLLILCL